MCVVADLPLLLTLLKELVPWLLHLRSAETDWRVVLGFHSELQAILNCPRRFDLSALKTHWVFYTAF